MSLLAGGLAAALLRQPSSTAGATAERVSHSQLAPCLSPLDPCRANAARFTNNDMCRLTEQVWGWWRAVQAAAACCRRVAPGPCCPRCPPLFPAVLRGSSSPVPPPPCQVIFTDPYYSAQHNRHTTPQLDGEVAALHADVEARVAASELKVCPTPAALGCGRRLGGGWAAGGGAGGPDPGAFPCALPGSPFCSRPGQVHAAAAGAGARRPAHWVHHGHRCARRLVVLPCASPRTHTPTSRPVARFLGGQPASHRATLSTH